MNWTMPAGMAAAIASFECHRRNIRSTNCMIVSADMEIISGTANCSTSRPPQRRVHQPVCSCVAISFMPQNKLCPIQALHRVVQDIASSYRIQQLRVRIFLVVLV